MMQRLTLAPARRLAGGQIDVLLDETKYIQFDGVDMRVERERSAVFKTLMDNFVNVMGLLAKEHAITKQIQEMKAADPNVNTAVLEAALATLRTQLQIEQ